MAAFATCNHATNSDLHTPSFALVVHVDRVEVEQLIVDFESVSVLFVY
jgi:hypothetical protein